MEKISVGAIILAGGLSARMGEPKQLLPIGGETVIERITRIYSGACDEVIVVTGCRGREVSERVAALGAINVKTVYNELYETGMFSSVLAGARALSDGIGAFFMTPADCCAVKSETLVIMLERYDGKILYPTFKSRRGHPALIPFYLKDGLLKHNGANGARGYLSGLPTLEVETSDYGVLLDMDTPRDYAAMLRYLRLTSQN